MTENTVVTLAGELGSPRAAPVRTALADLQYFAGSRDISSAVPALFSRIYKKPNHMGIADRAARVLVFAAKNSVSRGAVLSRMSTCFSNPCVRIRWTAVSVFERLVSESYKKDLLKHLDKLESLLDDPTLNVRSAAAKALMTLYEQVDETRVRKSVYAAFSSRPNRYGEHVSYLDAICSIGVTPSVERGFHVDRTRISTYPPSINLKSTRQLAKVKKA